MRRLEWESNDLPSVPPLSHTGMSGQSQDKVIGSLCTCFANESVWCDGPLSRGCHLCVHPTAKSQLSWWRTPTLTLCFLPVCSEPIPELVSWQQSSWQKQRWQQMPLLPLLVLHHKIWSPCQAEASFQLGPFTIGHQKSQVPRKLSPQWGPGSGIVSSSAPHLRTFVLA